MWHGLIANIPDGWVLCDGNNGTPDLRATFIKGAADGIEAGGRGGTITHRHSVSGNTSWYSTPHDHAFLGQTSPPNSGGNDVTDIGGGVMEYVIHTHDLAGYTEMGGGSHRHTFFDWSSYYNTFPTFYDLIFIMKT